MKILEECYSSRRWFCNWLFIRLPLFQKNNNLIAVDSSKQQALDADPKAIQQINFTGNSEGARNTMFFIL